MKMSSEEKAELEAILSNILNRLDDLETRIEKLEEVTNING